METQALLGLGWWKNFAEIAAWSLAALAAIAAGFVWFTGRELERRRSREEIQWRSRVSASEAAAEAARKEAEVLRKQLKPRNIPEEQRQRILAVLRRTKGRVEVRYPADPEAAAFAKRLAVLVEEAGWDVKQEGVMSFGPVIGVTIEVHSRERAPAYSDVLKEAIELVVGRITTRADAQLPADALILLVGSKEPPSP